MTELFPNAAPSTKMTIAKAPVLWIILTGIGNTMVGILIGGGFGPLLGLMLGPVAGGLAGLISGLILFAMVWLVSPSFIFTYPVTRWIGTGLIAFLAGLIANREWRIPLILQVCWIVLYPLIPYYLWPGPSWAGPLGQTWPLAILWSGLAPLILILLGIQSSSWIPDKLRRTREYLLVIAVWVTTWIATENYHLLDSILVNVQSRIPMPLNVYLGFVVSPFQSLLFYTVFSVLTSFVILWLRQSNLDRIPGTIWEMSLDTNEKHP